MKEALDDEEQDAEDCPKCPPQGLPPGWRLLRYGSPSNGVFVLILSFAEFNA